MDQGGGWLAASKIRAGVDGLSMLSEGPPAHREKDQNELPRLKGSSSN